MATKTKGPSVKKETAKKSADSLASDKSEGKQEKSVAKEADKTLAAVDSDDLLDDSEELEEGEGAAAESSNQSGNAAALAAAAGSSTEMSASFKNFRHHPDMENFYRFIYENDLRHEALAIIDEIIIEKQQRKQVKGPKSHPGH